MEIEEKQRLEKFAKILDLTFNNYEILKRSLIHRSYINENEGEEKHNERLEFLGDAVLELITTEYLFDKYPNRPEGDLTSFRAALVKTESLAETGTKLQFGEFLYISKGEEQTGGRQKPYLLANTYESILGGIYLDQGYETAKEFVHRTLIPKLENIVKLRLDIDNKSKLQELSQEQLGITPSYKLESEEGPDHNKIFTMQVLIGKDKFGTGEGKSKQEAEQNAANDALKNWENLVKELTKK